MNSSVLRRLSAAALIGSVLASFGAQPVGATATTTTSFVVTTLADTVADDGKCSLREAMTAIHAGAIDTDAGECGAPGVAPFTVTFGVSGTITLGSALPLLDQATTIDGGGKITIDGASQYRVLSVAFGPNVIKNLTIDHGLAATFGGAIDNEGTTTLQHLTVQNSTATGVGAEGGGIYNASSGALTIEDSLITGNHAANGAGVANSGGTIDVTRSTITGNSAADHGGGVFAGGASTTTFTGSAVSSNSAANGGGGIGASDAATVVMSTTIVHGNSSDAGGGGLWAFGTGTTWTIAGSTIDGNTAGAIGGGWGGGGTVTIVESTVSANTAASQGAGIALQGGTGVIANSTLAGNAGGTGAGFYVENGATATLTNDTITLNNSGSGDVMTNGGGTLTLANTIVAGNTAADISSGTVDTTLANLIAASSAGILDAGGLKDNGGPTKTVELLTTATDAINHGDAATCSAVPVLGVDQRGVTRPAACDIGAVERESVAPSASAPRTQLLAPGKLGSSTVPVRVTASWSDPGGSGVARFVLQRSVSGGAWTTVTSTMPVTGYTVSQAAGKAYRYRVRPVDHDGNVGSWSSISASATATIVQQNAASVTYHGTWSSTSSSRYSGGSEKYSKTKSASASFVFTGRGVALVGTTGPGRGQARIYVNGVLAATVDLGGATTTYRAVIWRGNWSGSAKRTVKVVVLATSGRPRVDLDAFAVLK